MRRRFTLFMLILALALGSLFAITAAGESAFDKQAFYLTFVRLNLWILAVTFYPKLMAALGADDLDEDWNRINEGNLAVALYRLTEFAVVGITAGMLIGKV